MKDFGHIMLQPMLEHQLIPVEVQLMSGAGLYLWDKHEFVTYLAGFLICLFWNYWSEFCTPRFHVLITSSGQL